MVDIPVIAIPTSHGYGLGEKGVSALMAMLQACSLGIGVVNIDGGIPGGTLAGLILCVFTACLGMFLEFTFINIFKLYHYTNPDFFGLPIWIAGHYIGGTPANMNFARKYLVFLHEREN